MSQTLTLNLSDEAFIAIQQQAKTIGVSPEKLISIFLEQWFTLAPQKEPANPEPASEFERHFGTLNLNTVDISNESIDADLAKAYANANEDD